MFTLGLLNPTTDMEKIGKRQKLLRLLCTNLSQNHSNGKPWLELFSGLLQKVQEYENSILSLRQADEFEHQLTQEARANEIPRWKKFSEWLTLNPISLTINESANISMLCIRQGVHVITIPIKALFPDVTNPYDANVVTKVFRDCFGLVKGGLRIVDNFVGGATDNFAAAQVAEHIFKVDTNFLVNSYAGPCMVAATKLLISPIKKELLQADDEFTNGKFVDAVTKFRLAMQQKLMFIAKFIALLREFNEALSTAQAQGLFGDQNIYDLIPSLKYVRAFEQETNQDNILVQLYRNTFHPETFENFLENLDTTTFKGEPSVFSFPGRVMRTHRLLTKYKTKIIDAFMALAEFDSILSVVRLIKEKESSRTPFCFAQFDAGDRPLVKLTRFWNPLLKDPQNAVLNDIVLGGTEPNSMVLTGPNGRGKSTALRAIAYSILLAKIWGIAPAQTCTLTPFANVRTFLSVMDHPSRSLSSFQGSAERSGQMADVAKEASKQSQHTILFFDELFKDTDPQAGESLVYGTLRDLAQVPKTLVIAATHFKNGAEQLKKEMPREFSFYNVSDGTDGKEKFSLQTGISSVSNALPESRRFISAEAYKYAEQYYAMNFKSGQP